MRKLAPPLALLALAGCWGYRAGFPLPPHIHTFTVAAFTNKTLERNLDFEFTQALIREIHAKTALRVAPPGEADLVIHGEIDAFERELLRRKRLEERDEKSPEEPVEGPTERSVGAAVPGSSSSGKRERLDEKSEMRHRLYVNVAMLDRKRNVLFFEGKRITRRVEFRLHSGETARMARDELVRELARRVVSLAFERWPPRPMEARARGG